MDHQHAQPLSAWPDWLTLGGLSGQECMQSVGLTTVIIAACSVVIILYALIGRLWWKWSDLNTGRSKWTLRWMFGIFALCGVCGYGSRIALVFVPAWTFYLVALIALIAVSTVYLWKARGMTVVFEDTTKVIAERDAAIAKAEAAERKSERIRAAIEKELHDRSVQAIPWGAGGNIALIDDLLATINQE